MTQIPDEWDLVRDSDTGGRWYETPDGVAYEKRNGNILGPTEHDVIRSAYEAIKERE